MVAMRLLIPGMLAGSTASAAPLLFQSSERQTALVELFTSEGCSSCPPAESWLSRLKENPGLWHDFVPVAFHVDYWDYLGWRDKWGSPQFSDRQRDYAQAWGSGSIYTPGFVLNGKEWRGWFGHRAAPAASGNKVGVLQASSEDALHWRVSFVPSGSGAAAYEVHAALLASGLSSDVKAGENAGHHLNHDFAALTLLSQALTNQNNGLHGSFTLRPDQEATKVRLGLAVWVARSGYREPMQAVGGWLPKVGKLEKD